MKSFGKVLLLFAVVLTAATAAKDDVVPMYNTDELPPPPPKLGKILFFFPLASKSILIMVMPLAEALAKRGHEVTAMAPQKYNKKTPSLDYIQIDYDFESITNTMSQAIMDTGDDSKAKQDEAFAQWMVLARESTDDGLGNAKFRAKLERGFDIVVGLPVGGGEVTFHLAHRSQASLVSIITLQNSGLASASWAVGAPHNPALLGNWLTAFTHPMSFWDRWDNTYATLMETVERYTGDFPAAEQLIDKHFPNDKRIPLPELEKNTSLLFIYGHNLLLDNVRPITPNIQHIGFMNCKAPNPLPKEFLDILSHKEGVVFFSFGSILKSKDMPQDRLKVLMGAFGRLKQKVIWKWETDQMAGKPDNVILAKWLPQSDLLGHPNLRLFITHAGLNSFQEAVCHRTPILAMPKSLDEFANAEEARVKGFGKYLTFETVTEDELYNALNEILTDPSYAKNAKDFGDLIMDNIKSPLYQAVWSMEFLLRHPGKNHFKAPSHDLAWYQLLLLDIIGLIVGAILAALILLIVLCRCIFCRKSSNNDAISRRKKNN